MTLRSAAAAALVQLSAVLGAGCGVGPEPLMPTPLVYEDVGGDLLRSAPAPRRSPPLDIFYATTRQPEGPPGDMHYRNKLAETLHVGEAVVEFGDESMTWEELCELSVASPRPAKVVLGLGRVREAATFDEKALLHRGAALSGPQREWIDRLNAELVEAATPEIIVYVHGAKVNFYNGCAVAAQVDHFLGRRLVPIAFCWPTHQDIFAYVGGEDRRRGYCAGFALAGLLSLLAERTVAEKIHVISWSAGGRVASQALTHLREAHPELTRSELEAKLRLGAVVFAAADVDAWNFMERLRSIDDVSERAIVTVTDDDEALAMSRAMMGGRRRIGVQGPLSAEDRMILESTAGVEVVDVSLGRDERGFDIGGHKYWFRNPWVSSDLLMAILFDLAAEERGLVPDDTPAVWALPSDYPDRVREIVPPKLDALGVATAPREDAGGP